MTDTRFNDAISQLERDLPVAEARRRVLEDELAAAVATENALRGALESLRLLSGLPLPLETDSAPEIGHTEESGLVEVIAEQPAEPAGESGADPTATRKPAPVTRAAVKKPTEKGSTGRRATAKKSTTKAASKESEPAGTISQTTTHPGARRRSVAKKAATKKAVAQSKTAKPVEPVQITTPVPAPRRRRTGITAESILKVLSESDGPLRAKAVVAQLGIDDEPGTVNSVRTALERLAKAGRAQRAGRGLYAGQGN
ncbi:hypothetical protein ABT263_26460 [Kitasatospora sp. NPDC001603]|uniref:hypothetical protein n=1 Tax=Kitasatospora sp. NPDC001603 TaxID=3154388 RepID=UPI003330FBA7